MIPRDFKGKARANGQMEGGGGADGIVLPLEVVGSGIFDIAYTIEVSVGSNGQQLYLQVDTGSSDLWIASKSCSSSPCGKTSNHLYDPSSSTRTDEHFNISYLQGEVSGPVVWDKFVVGGYSLDAQALAAADSVSKEPLGPNFSGILGLALPLNSVIAGLITPVTTNSPDGAAWASNLFSITPVSSAPSARFLSLLLSRPSFDAVPAQLGIGRHPSFVKDPSTVEYAKLVSESQGTLFWKVGVQAITVWVNGEERPVQIGGSHDGRMFPSAVLDSGVPLILTTSAVANGIYGAIGVQPGSDGQYYVPCTQPLNLTITLDDRTPIPLHPLDLTAEPTTNDNFCVGLIQAADPFLTSFNAPADIILGVPFLRNTYTVMAYEPPGGSGVFNTSNTSPSDITPRLGLVGITDPTKALDEFHTIRVLKQPISSSAGSGSGTTSDSNGGATVGKHVSVGIIVLVSLLGFFALCIGLFGLRWCLTRRRYRRGFVKGDPSPGSSSVLAGIGRGTEKDGGYEYALTSNRGSKDLKLAPSKELYGFEDTMRSGWEPYMQDHGLVDLGLGSPEKSEEHSDGHRDREMGLREGERGKDVGWSDADQTLVMGRGEIVSAHERTSSSGTPLLHDIHINRGHSPTSSASSSRSRSVDEFGVLPHSAHLEDDAKAGAGDRTSMAGVGTAARKTGRRRDGSDSGWDQPFALVDRRDASGTSTNESDVVFRTMPGGAR